MSAVVVIALCAPSRDAFAQAVGAGGQIQQIPQAPTLQRTVPELPIPQNDHLAQPELAGPRFPVRALHITGATRFSENELIAATGFTPGAELSLGDLRNLASKITNLYNRNGYFVAQAYLPPQDIKDGNVTIAVIEGRYGKIGLDNKTNVSDRVVNDILDGLNSGDPVVAPPLERRLLIISDIPGVEVNSTLSPGDAVGTSDLMVDLTPGARVNGSVEADNAGNPYTGVYRAGATVNFNEPFEIGDVLSARFLLSTNGGMDYGRLSYQAQVGDGTVGAAYTAFRYKLGRQFSVLDASGTEGIVSLFGSYPIVRSYDDNLYALLDVDDRNFQDKIGAASSIVDKQAWVASPGISGDHRDMFGGGGWDSYSLIASFGTLDIQSPLARAIDGTTAKTDGSYAKLYFSASRLQHLIGPLSLYGLVRGQIASKNLDISEKMELGGAYGVRAYPEGEAYGDEGYIATLEARLLLPRWFEQLPGDLEFISFVDTGSVRFNKSPWFTGPNSATRSGAGIGLNWLATNDFEVSATYAWELGGRATSAPDHFGGFWISVVKHF
jgi:hemolysin activation/secretion protein